MFFCSIKTTHTILTEISYELLMVLQLPIKTKTLPSCIAPVLLAGHFAF